MFTLQDAAVAYAKGAERILGEDANFLNGNQEVIPVFVSLLFQSLEISLKYLGIEAKLFSEQEARDRKLTRNGHGIKEISDLVNARLGADKDYPVIMAITAGLNNNQAADILHKMIFGEGFDRTRQSYQSRNLGYSQLKQGELALLNGLKPWVIVIREVAENLSTAIRIVSKWKNSTSDSKVFAIWYKECEGHLAN
ncbi:MAG: hypothetical protein WA081_20655 [Desulfosalsimonadaceae bacterium]